MNDLGELKSILLGDEQESIARLEKHVLEPTTRAEDVSKALVLRSFFEIDAFHSRG